MKKFRIPDETRVNETQLKLHLSLFAQKAEEYVEYALFLWVMQGWLDLKLTLECFHIP